MIKSPKFKVLAGLPHGELSEMMAALAGLPPETCVRPASLRVPVGPNSVKHNKRVLEACKSPALTPLLALAYGGGSRLAVKPDLYVANHRATAPLPTISEVRQAMRHGATVWVDWHGKQVAGPWELLAPTEPETPAEHQRKLAQLQDLLLVQKMPLGMWSAAGRATGICAAMGMTRAEVRGLAAELGHADLVQARETHAANHVQAVADAMAAGLSMVEIMKLEASRNPSASPTAIKARVRRIYAALAMVATTGHLPSGAPVWMHSPALDYRAIANGVLVLQRERAAAKQRDVVQRFLAGEAPSHIGQSMGMSLRSVLTILDTATIKEH